MESLNNICSMAHRRYEEVPIEKVKVIQFSKSRQGTIRHERREYRRRRPDETDPSQRQVLESAGHFELICGEGRLLAIKILANRM